MYPLTRFLSFAAAGTLALSVASIPARADELAQNLGPVAPNDPILTTVVWRRNGGAPHQSGLDLWR